MSHRPLIFPRFRLAEIVETYRFPIVPVHQQLENFPRNPSDKSHVPYASPIHPPPSSFLSSISVLSLSSSFYLLFHRFLPTVCHRSGREGKGREGGRHSRRNLRDRSNRLSHASADQGWPSRLPPSSGDFPLEFTSVFTDRQMRAMKPGTREDGAKIHLTRQDESHPFVAWNDQIGETLTRPFARWPVTRAGRRGIGCRDSMIGGGRGYFRYWIFVGLIIDVAVAKSWILFDLRRRNRG